MKIERSVKRETDLQIISGWIGDGSRVLDLGCGRGVLLDQLRRKCAASVLGVDVDPDKIDACVKKGVPVYQGDAEAFLRLFDDGYFDWIILSRTVQELDSPGQVIREALRAGKRLAVGFENHAYWRNRFCTLFTGCAGGGEFHRGFWPEKHRYNPVSIKEFESFCAENGMTIAHKKYLAGNWKTQVESSPSWRAAYALYAIEKA